MQHNIFYAGWLRFYQISIEGDYFAIHAAAAPKGFHFSQCYAWLLNTVFTIWLPFSHIDFPSLAANYTTPFTQYVNYLKSNFGTKWANNVRVFYNEPKWLCCQ